MDIKIYNNGAYITQATTDSSVTLPFTSDFKNIQAESGGKMIPFSVTPGYIPGGGSRTNYGREVKVVTESGSVSGRILSEGDGISLLTDGGEVITIRKWISIQGSGRTTLNLKAASGALSTVKYRVGGLSWSPSMVVIASPGGTGSIEKKAKGFFGSSPTASPGSPAGFSGTPYNFSVKLTARIDNTSVPVSGLVSLIAAGDQGDFGQYTSNESYRVASYAAPMATMKASSGGSGSKGASLSTDYTIFLQKELSIPLSITSQSLGEFKVSGRKYYTVDISPYGSSSDSVPAQTVLSFITPQRLPSSPIVVSDESDVKIATTMGSMRAEGDEVELQLSNSFLISAKMTTTREDKTPQTSMYPTKRVILITTSSSIKNTSSERALVYLVYPTYGSEIRVKDGDVSRYSMKGNELRISVIVEGGETNEEIFSFETTS